ncbi:MAG: GGDEF domain-containing protein [Bryobacteraceae bacterium]
MDLGVPTRDISSLIFQISLLLIFALIFYFLWRQSKIVYFGLWSVAWLIQAAALPVAFVYAGEPAVLWIWLYGLLEFAFAVLLFAAARAGFSGQIRDWRSPLKILLGYPVFLMLVYASGLHARTASLQALHAVVLCSVYLYNYTGVRTQRFGGQLFRLSLLCLAVVFLFHAVVLVYLWSAGGRARGWESVLDYDQFYDFGLHAVLAFAALIMWIENQQEHYHELRSELDRIRRENSRYMDLDDLTGLLNHAALDRRLREIATFNGVAAVCDMDNFKEVNDCYGHLTGDEILRSIGRLFQASIRKEDEAFRWGGDEFVILFQNQNRELVDGRMQELRSRLKTFRVRGIGVLPISFSWGTAEGGGKPLRDTLEQADRQMYSHKGTRRT